MFVGVCGAWRRPPLPPSLSLSPSLPPSFPLAVLLSHSHPLPLSLPEKLSRWRTAANGRSGVRPKAKDDQNPKPSLEPREYETLALRERERVRERARARERAREREREWVSVRESGRERERASERARERGRERERERAHSKYAELVGRDLYMQHIIHNKLHTCNRQ